MKKEYNVPTLTEVILNVEDLLLVSFTKENDLNWGGEANEIF